MDSTARQQCPALTTLTRLSPRDMHLALCARGMHRSDYYAVEAESGRPMYEGFGQSFKVPLQTWGIVGGLVSAMVGSKLTASHMQRVASRKERDKQKALLNAGRTAALRRGSTRAISRSEGGAASTPDGANASSNCGVVP